MGDNMKKVRSGDPLVIPAATFNTFIDAARDYLMRGQNMRKGQNRSSLSRAGVFTTLGRGGIFYEALRLS